MKKVLLGMSGGVDSSVSAIILKQKGYEVYGVTMKLWGPNEDEDNMEGGCCNISSSMDAKRVCDSLEIPHYTLNFKDRFKDKVIENFICEYSNCRTPNPCIECNKYLKFGEMWNTAKQIGCNYIATGHYAKVEYSEKYNRFVLKKSNNKYKDQSYVLWSIPKEMLEHIVFPLEEIKNKEEIRKIAKEHEISVANKPDSQDICFIPDGNYKRFLQENSDLKPTEGNIVNTNGKILGKHSGLYNYTIGQRKGLGISNKVPLFVLGFNKFKNEVIVGEESELYKKEIWVDNINLLLFDEIKEKIKVQVKTRYSAKAASATIEQMEDKIKVVFDDMQKAITPGQSAVFYLDDIVVGGGKIL